MVQLTRKGSIWTVVVDGRVVYATSDEAQARRVADAYEYYEVKPATQEQSQNF